MVDLGSRLNDIYNHLKSKGYDVYFPAQHSGECINLYVVIKLSTPSKLANVSSVQDYYDIMLYVPRNEYSKIEKYIFELKENMKELYPMIMPTYTQTATYYDDTVKGHMVSVMYRNNKKICNDKIKEGG